MGATTGIEWTDATWPVVKGCDYVSPGCANCYAADLIHRHSHNPNEKISLPVRGLVEVRGGRPRWTGKVYLNEPHLHDPLKWKAPKRIFVPSHGDLFHADVPFGFVMRVLDVMARTPWHTYQVLTKRPDRMAELFGRWADLSGEGDEPKLVRGPAATRAAHPSGRGQLFADMLEAMGDPPAGCAYPTFDWMEGMTYWPALFRHIHLGFSAESQEWYDRRLAAAGPLLRAGWTVFVSAEPLLGPIDFGFDHECGDPPHHACPPTPDWVIVGGESGKQARPMDVEWVRSAVRQCKAAGVACFVKQLGAKPFSAADHISYRGGTEAKPDGFYRHLNDPKGGDMDEFPADLQVREFPGR